MNQGKSHRVHRYIPHTIYGLLLFAAAVKAHAFVGYVAENGELRRWSLTTPFDQVHTNVVNRTTHAVRYFLSADAYSASSRDAELTAARTCFDQWQAVPNSILRFEEGGLLPGALDVNTSDNTNVVYWAKTSTLVNGGLDNIRGLPATTFADAFSNGAMAEADVVLNGVDYSWFTDINNQINKALLVEAFLLHEVGHFIGLAHSPVGAATMFPRMSPGVNVQIGLSPDEIAACHTLYPDSLIAATLGRLRGTVTMKGAPVFGAMLIAEDASGGVMAGTISLADGTYDMPSLLPGQYQVRASPVDPTNQVFFLFRGSDVAGAFAQAQVNFAATTNRPVTVTMGGTARLDFAVGEGPPFRIVKVRPPMVAPPNYVAIDYAVAVPETDRDLVVGVYSTQPFGNEAILRVTGDGLSFGPTEVRANAIPGANPPLHALSVTMHLDPGATPGMRSLIVQQASGWAYANGFIEIPPRVPDYNFDGLDDRYQRRFFGRWTSPASAPGADPDGDGYTNQSEYAFDSDPTSSASLPSVQSVRWDATGATVRWHGAPGKRYQVWSRPQVNSRRGWQTLGEPVLSSGGDAEYLDVQPGDAPKFYRVQVLP